MKSYIIYSNYDSVNQIVINYVLINFILIFEKLRLISIDEILRKEDGEMTLVLTIVLTIEWSTNS